MVHKMDSVIIDDERQKINEVEKKVAEQSRRMMLHLYQCWRDLGIDRDTRLMRIENLIQIFSDFNNDIIMETEERCLKLKNDIEALQEEASHLSRLLGRDIKYHTDQNLPLFKTKEQLEEILEKYRIEMREREMQVKRLIRWQEELCTALGMEKREIVTDPLPSEHDVQLLNKDLEKLQAEREMRMEIFLRKQKHIHEIMSELGLEPILKFEMCVVKSRSMDFTVSDDNMLHLAHLEDDLMRQLEETRNKMMELRERLAMLWERLEEEPSYRSNFLEAHPGCTQATEKAIREEIARCEEKKRQNIKMFIARIRTEIKRTWDDCLFGAEERLEFPHFNSDIYTEDVLTLHELYLEKIKNFYSENSHIYELVKLRSELWQKLLDLEERASQPNRYQNRGGQLLREEKERKNTNTKLPKIEAELSGLLIELEQRTGRTFTINGKALLQSIQEDMENFKMEKHNKVSARKQKSCQTPNTPLIKGSILALSPLGKRNATAASMMSNRHLGPSPSKRALRNITSVDRTAIRHQQIPRRGAVTSIKRRVSPRQASRLLRPGDQNGQASPKKPNVRRINFGEKVAEMNNVAAQRKAATPKPVQTPKITVNGNILKQKARLSREGKKKRRSGAALRHYSRSMATDAAQASATDTATASTDDNPSAPSQESTLMTSFYTDFQEHLHENTSSRSSLAQSGLARTRSKLNFKPLQTISQTTPLKMNKPSRVFTPKHGKENHQVCTDRMGATPKSRSDKAGLPPTTPTFNRITRSSMTKTPNGKSNLDTFATPRPVNGKVGNHLIRQNTMTLSSPKLVSPCMLTRSNSSHSINVAKFGSGGGAKGTHKLQVAKNLPLII